jgi:hypothetical protein
MRKTSARWRFVDAVVAAGATLLHISGLEGDKPPLVGHGHAVDDPHRAAQEPVIIVIEQNGREFSRSPPSGKGVAWLSSARGIASGFQAKTSIMLRKRGSFGLSKR